MSKVIWIENKILTTDQPVWWDKESGYANAFGRTLSHNPFLFFLFFFREEASNFSLRMH